MLFVCSSCIEIFKMRESHINYTHTHFYTQSTNLPFFVKKIKTYNNNHSKKTMIENRCFLKRLIIT